MGAIQELKTLGKDFLTKKIPVTILLTHVDQTPAITPTQVEKLLVDEGLLGGETTLFEVHPHIFKTTLKADSSEEIHSAFSTCVKDTIRPALDLEDQARNAGGEGGMDEIVGLDFMPTFGDKEEGAGFRDLFPDDD